MDIDARLTNLGRLWAFVRLGRPLFLVGGFVMHGLGVAIALYAGAPLNVPALIWGQLAVTATQTMTHYANEYFDLAADCANPTSTYWTGGSRVLPQGILAARVALRAALVLAAVAVLALVVLVTMVQPGLVTFGLLLVGLILSWEYSAPPLVLHSRGVGALTVALIVPVLTPLLGYHLQTGRLDLLPLLAVLPLACLQVASTLTIEFPDVAGDALAGKRTLAVRWGSGAAHFHNGAVVATYLLLPWLYRLGLPRLLVLAIVAPLPLALWQIWRVHQGDWRDPGRWEGLVFGSIALLMGTAGLEGAAFLWLALGTAS